MSEGEKQPGGVERDGYYYLFDYLRIILAVGVFVFHATRGSWIPDQFGNGCVQIFFALSGFLIGGIVLASKRTDLPRFYFNRCTRIWIPYGVAILLLLGGTVLRQNLNDAKLWEIFFYKATFVYNLFGLQQLGRFMDHMPLQGTGNHFWSICVEEQFYLVAPFLLLFARRLSVPLLLVVVAVNVVWPNDFAAVALGVLLAVSRQRFGAWYLAPRGRAACLAALVLSGSLFWLWPGHYRTVVVPFAVALVALTAVPGRARRLGVTLGGMSYPFYLNHWLGLYVRNPLARAFHLSAVATGVIAFFVALTFAFAHYRTIDRRIHERRSRWFTPRRGVIACATAMGLIVVGVAGGLALR